MIFLVGWFIFNNLEIFSKPLPDTARGPNHWHPLWKLLNQISWILRFDKYRSIYFFLMTHGHISSIYLNYKNKYKMSILCIISLNIQLLSVAVFQRRLRLFSGGMFLCLTLRYFWKEQNTSAGTRLCISCTVVTDKHIQLSNFHEKCGVNAASAVILNTPDESSHISRTIGRLAAAPTIRQGAGTPQEIFLRLWLR